MRALYFACSCVGCSRAAMLSSPLSDESELQELRESSGTAKMIESTSGRFEIGDDEIDDPEL